MDRFLIIIFLLLISCNKDSDLTRDNNKALGIYVKRVTFIHSPGRYYFKDIDIVVKQFKDDAIVYGIFNINNDLLYQRNINHSISDHMKWTIYVDNKDHIWFYNTDYQEISMFFMEGKKGVFVDDKNKLPSIPTELSKFIKE